jgi:hypothetical protein
MSADNYPDYNSPEALKRLEESAKSYSTRHHPTKGRNEYLDFESSFKYKYTIGLKENPELSFEEFLVSELNELDSALEDSSLCLELDKYEQTLRRIETLKKEEQEDLDNEEFEDYQKRLSDLKVYCETRESKDNEYNELWVNNISFTEVHYNSDILAHTVALNLLKQSDKKTYDNHIKSKKNLTLSSRHKEFLLHKLLDNLDTFYNQNITERFNIIGAIVGASETNIRKRPPFHITSENDYKESEQKIAKEISDFWEVNTPKKEE